MKEEVWDNVFTCVIEACHVFTWKIGKGDLARSGICEAVFGKCGDVVQGFFDASV